MPTCPRCHAATSGPDCPWCTTKAFAPLVGVNEKLVNEKLHELIDRAVAPAERSLAGQFSMEDITAQKLDELAQRASTSRDQRVVTAVAERVAQARAADIRRVRQRLTSLLRPVVDEDFTDEELEGLANAMMATMASLGGEDVEAVFCSDAPSPSLPACDLW